MLRMHFFLSFSKGKSTVSSQLAFTLQRMNKEVGLLDIDICGPSIPKIMGIESEQIHQSNLGWEPVYVGTFREI